ncbi:MAG: hypothetical protein SFY56_15175, partial [Bacteroidota bacterium]|nr:hypothetical protein [Bacteroidota bacterium]
GISGSMKIRSVSRLVFVCPNTVLRIDMDKNIKNAFFIFVVWLVTYNVLALGEEADFEALNCLPALNLLRSTRFQLTTEPAFLPNACYL